jgi:hypothetical protein
MKSETYSLDSSLKKGCESLNETFTQCLRDFEDKVRSTPLVAVSVAAAVGYLLRFFPIAGILSVVVKLFLFAIKPLIVLFGAIKLYEFIRTQSGDIRSSGDAERDREPLLDSPSGPPPGP